jgi:glycosyl transferase family 25
VRPFDFRRIHHQVRTAPQTHLINLDRSQGRLAEFVTANRHLTEVVRFPAIDGSSLDIGALAQQGLVAPDILDSYSLGAVGLALSHGTLWQAATTQGQTITVAEDDTVFHFRFEALAEEVLKSLPPDWDMIFWSWNFDATMMFDVLPGVCPCVAQFDQNKLRAHIPDFQQLPLSPRAHKLLWLFGTGSYTVSPRGAQNLRSRCFPLRPMLISWPDGLPRPAGSIGMRNVGIVDATLNGIYRDLQAFVCFPPLVVSPNDHSKSTVQGAAAAAQSPPPDDAASFANHGMELLKLNRREEALAQFEKALSLKPDDIVALASRGNTLFDLGRYDAALANCDQLLLQRPKDASALNMRGLILEAFKRPEEALASYDKAVAAAPEVVEALYNRGNILADLSRFEEALASYDKALLLAPDAAPVLNNRGLVL